MGENPVRKWGKIWRWSCGVQMMLLCTMVRDGDRSVVVAVMVQRYFIRAVVPMPKYLTAGPRNNCNFWCEAVVE